jgi:hypothetical protein
LGVAKSPLFPTFGGGPFSYHINADYEFLSTLAELVSVGNTYCILVVDLGLDDTLASREEINRTLTQKISNVFLNWEFKLLKVELLEILPSETIPEAMHKQIAAERMRRAAIITADGYREQTKTEGKLINVIKIYSKLFVTWFILNCSLFCDA